MFLRNYDDVEGYICRFCKDSGIDAKKIKIDRTGLKKILEEMASDDERNSNRLSVFKRAASFIGFFCHSQIIKTDILVSHLFSDDLIRNIPNASNGVMAFEIVIEALHGATVVREGEAPMELKDRIELSTHSYIDVVDAFSRVTKYQHYKLIAVLLEQLAYRTNPHCSYTE